MAYPLIILGAGASMDYLRADDHIEHRINDYSKYRAPLMNELFDDTRFHTELSRHPEIDSLASDAMNAMSRPNPNFEDYLTNARDTLSKNNPDIFSQLIALIFYLADLFSVISEKFYYPRNHYKDILHKIDNYCEGQACFVNLNYDLLLERSLYDHSKGKFDYLKIDNFVSSNIKIIKIHGACNWRYQPQTVQAKETTAVKFFSTFSKELILGTKKDQICQKADDITNIGFKPEYSVEENYWTVKLPAIALPLKNKPDNYVCDVHHIDILKENMKKTDRVLIIGWRGVDQYVLKLLKDELGDRKIPVAVITKNTTSDVIIDYYASTVPQFNIHPEDVYPIGFSKFMKTDGYEKFFTNRD